MNILEIKNLNVKFRTKNNNLQALFNVNLTLEEGKTLAIVGESGCGKTLTAMSVIQLLPNTAFIESGSILYKNKNLLLYSNNEMQKIRGKEIALIPQDPMTSLNPLYTIENQLIEVIKIHQNIAGKEAEKVAIDVLDKVKIPNAKECLKCYPHEFSGGMKQRVIIAMAIACNASIIIADEPTTALDVTVQAQIMDLLKEIQNTYKTSIILISHDLGLVYENAEDIAVMYAGNVVEYAKSDILFTHPKHPYTKSLLKSLPTQNTQKLEVIEGYPPTLQDVMLGCSFEPRCKEKINMCKLCKPEMLTVDQTKVKCLLYN